MNRLASVINGVASMITGSSPESFIPRDFISVRCIDEDKIALAIYDVPPLNRALRRELGVATQEELQAEYRHMDPEALGELIDGAHQRLAGRTALYGAVPKSTESNPSRTNILLPFSGHQQILRRHTQ